MPQQSLWEALFEKLHGGLPDLPEPTPEQQTEWDRKVLEQQSKESLPKKIGRGIIDVTGGIFEGLMGNEPDSTRRGVGDFTNLATQGVTGLAGLPFAAYKALGKLPKGKLFHGTQRAPFDLFDPDKNDISDVLGWLTHSAENPNYANRYAMGKIKSGTHISETGPFNLQGYDESGKSYKAAPRVIPIEPEAKNVLDLVEPNMDDLSQAVASLNKFEKEKIIDRFKHARAITRESPNKSPQDMLEDLGIRMEHIENKPNLSPSDIPGIVLADKLRLNPESFKRSPFDAIRYHDVDERSWAFPETTQLKTPYGVSLNEPPRDIRILKSFEPKGGELELRPDRWANTPLDLPDTPIPEIYKTDNPNMPVAINELFEIFSKTGIPNKSLSLLSKKKSTLSAWNTPYKDVPIEEIIKDQAIPMFPGMTPDLAEEASQQIDQMMEWGQITKKQYYELQTKLNQFMLGQ